MVEVKRFLFYSRPTPFDQFNALVRELSLGKTVVISAGCGTDPSIGLTSLAERVIGIDLDPRAKMNSDIHLLIMSDLSNIPLQPRCAHVILARWVLEHVRDPASFFWEVYRLLKPGGSFVFLTPNAWHYTGLAIRLTPHSFHKWFVRRVLSGDPEHVFPTRYAANTPAKIRRLAEEVGLNVEMRPLLEGPPSLLRFSRLALAAGLLYDRIVSRWDLFEGLRSAILGVLSRPLQASSKRGDPPEYDRGGRIPLTGWGLDWIKPLHVPLHR